MKTITTYIKRALEYALLISALYEGAYGIGQLLGFIPSGNYRFPVTGTFYNPGPYACYLALTFPLALYAFFHGKSKLAQALGAIVLVADAIILPCTMSRTAWLAALAGAIVAFHSQIFKFIRRHRLQFGAIIIVGSIAAGIGAYKMKPESADGRLLMWKVACQAVSPAPFTDVGWDCVAGKYGEAQERYFSEGNGSENEELVADAPQYVFNEYLQVAIAYGWGWTALMIALFAGAIAIALTRKNPAIAGCVVAAVIVMAASYPFQFQISVATIALIVMAAFISAENTAVGVIGTALTAAMFLAFRLGYTEYDNRHNFSTAHSLHQAGQWRRSNAILLDMLPHSSDPMPLNIIGKNYKELGMPDSAEFYFKRSASRCPNRLYPHYLLMKLYSDSASANDAKAQAKAETIITKNEKIPSPAIEEMRLEAKKIIDNKQK